MSSPGKRVPQSLLDAIAAALSATLQPVGGEAEKNGGLPTDWHFSPGLPPYIRTSGTLRPAQGCVEWPWDWPDDAKEYLARLYREKTDDLSYEWGGWRFRLQMQVLTRPGSVSMVGKLRRIPQVLPSRLRLPKAFLDTCAKPRGIILVSGPTGSGKSTTLAKMVRDHLAVGISVSMWENPIEYRHTSSPDRLIEQFEMESDFSSYSAAMRRILRKDPDVIIPSELIEPEAFASAISSAETGHLVIGTMHLSNTPGVINRVVEATKGAGDPGAANIYRDMLSGSLLACLCQQLVPLREGGRVAAFELLLKHPNVTTIIGDPDAQAMRQQLDSYVSSDGLRHGSFSMEHSLAVLLSLGRITEETAFEYAGRMDLMRRHQDLVQQARTAPSALFDLYR